MQPEHYVIAGILLVGIAVAALIWRLARRGPRWPHLEFTGQREPERSAWFIGILAAAGLVVLLGLLDDLSARLLEAEAAAARRLDTSDCPPPRTDLSETIVVTATLRADGRPTDVYCFRAGARSRA